MNKITDAIMLRETSPRSHTAMVYGIAGILVGALFLGGKNE